jgi:hypothetical protein
MSAETFRGLVIRAYGHVGEDIERESEVQRMRPGTSGRLVTLWMFEGGSCEQLCLLSQPRRRPRLYALAFSFASWRTLHGSNLGC